MRGHCGNHHTPGTINVDFEDLKTVMSERGTAIIGLASASGPDRARVAAEKAIACPLLEGANLQGARGLLAYFTGNESVTLAEIKEPWRCSTPSSTRAPS